VIESQVWNLNPRDAGGQLLPLPEVPWDSDKESRVFTPPKNIAVFIEGKRFPDNSHVARLIAHFQDHHQLTVYTLDGVLEEPGKYQTRKFKAHAINKHDAVVLFPESFVFRPMGAKHVAVLWKKLDFPLDFTGYTVYRVPGVEGECQKLPAVAEFLHEIVKAPTVMVSDARRDSPRKPRHPVAEIHRPRRPTTDRPDTTGRASGFYIPGKRAIRETLTVKIVNVTGADWEKGTHFVGGFWATHTGAVRGDAPRTKTGLPVAKVRPGETGEEGPEHPKRAHQWKPDYEGQRDGQRVWKGQRNGTDKRQWTRPLSPDT